MIRAAVATAALTGLVLLLVTVGRPVSVVETTPVSQAAVLT